MKVLLVTDYAAHSGGAELAISILRDGLRELGHDARVFGSTALRERGGFFADYECLGTTSRWRTLLQSGNLWAAAQIRRALDDFKPDVVHVSMFLTQLSPLILPALRDVPSLYHAHWHRAICPTGLKLLPDGNVCHDRWGAICHHRGCIPLRDFPPLMVQMKLWERWRETFDLTVAVCGAVRDRLVADGMGPVTVIPNGIPAGPARPPLTGAPTVAFAGRFTPEKGIDLLVRAFARAKRECPEARLRLLGTGPQWEAIAQLVRDLDLMSDVWMPGYVEHEAAQLELAGAWVQVLPSRWEEPFPLAGLETMMRGTALVGSRMGGLPEMIRPGETGLLFPRDDEEALADALIAVCRDHALAERMGCAARRVALEQYTDATYVQRFVETYEQLLRG
jgi:glycosyltransferase involved in cell wall biosynthesis